ncbi:MAG TPA: ParB N-terminal domain-containing protein [Clostridia bacterium]|nr:ParB N-terminal domain-containing protein [Clostridia bacterium]
MGKFSVTSIMNEKSVEQIKEQRRVVPVPRDLIDPSEENHYSMNDIESLAASIEAVGLLDPLILRQKPNGRYAIISGHRRNAAIGLLAEEAPEGL